MQPVKMYTSEYCPYCVQAKNLLQRRGVERIEEIRVDEFPQERMTMMQLTGRRTVPQIFIGATHVGGCDDLVALDRRGGLLPLLGADCPGDPPRSRSAIIASTARATPGQRAFLFESEIPPWPKTPHRPPYSRSSAST